MSWRDAEKDIIQAKGWITECESVMMQRDGAVVVEAGTGKTWEQYMGGLLACMKDSLEQFEKDRQQHWMRLIESSYRHFQRENLRRLMKENNEKVHKLQKELEYQLLHQEDLRLRLEALSSASQQQQLGRIERLRGKEVEGGSNRQVPQPARQPSEEGGPLEKHASWSQ